MDANSDQDIDVCRLSGAVISPLHEQPLLPHLIVRSLAAHDDAPCIYLAGRIASYAEVRRRTSQLIQAQRARGVHRGTRLAVLSKNRPEVLTNLTASLVNGCVVTPLHPMGSLADHAVRDRRRRDRVPRLRRRQLHRASAASSRRSTPISYCSASDPTTSATTTSRSPTSSSRPRSNAPDVALDDLCTVVYTGGTTGRPKGVLMTHRVWQAMTWIQMAEWEFPDDLRLAIATPLSHAAMSLVAPGAAVGRSVLRDGRRSARTASSTSSRSIGSRRR